MTQAYVLVQARKRRCGNRPGTATASAAFAPKACGSSATAAARSSSRPTSKPTSTSAPSASHHFHIDARSSASTCCSSRATNSSTCGLRSTDPLELHRPQALQAAPAQSPGRNRPQRRHRQRRRPARPARTSSSAPWSTRSSAAAWARWSAKPSPAPSTARSRRRQPAHHRRRLRRRAHDGRHRQPDADGQDLRRASRSSTTPACPTSPC